MKIWITKENEGNDGIIEAHKIKPKREDYYTFSHGNVIDEDIIKAILNLDDWPNHEEVLEYDTVKEEGVIYHGREL